MKQSSQQNPAPTPLWGRMPPHTTHCCLGRRGGYILHPDAQGGKRSSIRSPTWGRDVREGVGPPASSSCQSCTQRPAQHHSNPPGGCGCSSCPCCVPTPPSFPGLARALPCTANPVPPPPPPAQPSPTDPRCSRGRGNVMLVGLWGLHPGVLAPCWVTAFLHVPRDAVLG